jgi:type VI secretion system Hcp family effector
VLTVGGSTNDLTIESPTPNLGHSIGLVTLFGNGATNAQLSFDIAGLNLLNNATSGTGGGGGASKVAAYDITITKPVDSASPKLSKACATGEHFKTVKIFMRKAGKTYLTYTLNDVLISSYQTGGSGKADQPTESLSPNFGRIAFQHAQQK